MPDLAPHVEVLTHRFAGRAVYDLYRPRGPVLPVLLAVPHSGRDYDDGFMSLTRLNNIDIRRSEDAYLDEIFMPATAMGAAMLVARFPRAYVDVNRESYELDSGMFDEALPGPPALASQHVAAGLGVIPKIVAAGMEIYERPLPVSEAAHRIDNYYAPWHACLAREIARIKARFGYCILLDCHSMPSASVKHEPVEDGSTGPDFVLGDCYGLSCGEALIASLHDVLTAAGYKCGRNRPYAGGYISRSYGRPHEGVQSVQIEISRALYMNEANMKKTKGIKALEDISVALVAAALPPGLAEAAE